MKRVGWCLLMAVGLAVPSQATSPEPPVKAVLRPRAAVFGPQGRSALQLRVTVKDKKDLGEYTVEVKRMAPPPVAGLERGAPKPLASAAVRDRGEGSGAGRCAGDQPVAGRARPL
jgi:hypothetical protein